ncbi:MAG: succinate dehydrogenase [Paracoccaceae bacterium]
MVAETQAPDRRSIRLEARLFVIQRLSALVLAPLVLTHIVLILYAVEGGLTAAEILSRTQGSLGWALFYGVFVLAASVHAAIGLRTILREWTRAEGRMLDTAMAAVSVALILTGLRGVYAVTWGGA